MLCRTICDRLGVRRGGEGRVEICWGNGGRAGRNSTRQVIHLLCLLPQRGVLRRAYHRDWISAATCTGSVSLIVVRGLRSYAITFPSTRTSRRLARGWGNVVHYRLHQRRRGS